MSDPIVIVGGGLAAGTAVTELRSQGYDGPVVVFAEEAHAPYERPPLSKDYLMGKAEAADAFVQDDDWYAAHDVDLRTGTKVTAVDTGARTVTAGDETLTYDTLLLATGSRARHLAMADGSGVPVHYLRTLDDSTALREHLGPDTRLAIIGGGWIGLEVAAAARTAGASVVLLESLDLPLVRVLGPEVAQVFAALHREHDVDLRTGVEVTGIEKTADGARITLRGGDTVDCDRLVVGVGVEPAVELAEGSGLTVDNGIRVDAELRTSDPHVYAAGDVANVDHPVLGHPLRVEHWDTAKKHGAVAAANLVGGNKQADDLPYFFTDQYDLGMEYVGNPGPEGYDDVVLRGDVPGLNFTAWWLRGALVVAGMQVNDWDAIGDVRRLVGQHVDVATLRDDGTALGDVPTRG
jgi:3-phenylpropionate/trans-cinnamate dioxygenase ferredoxin reductase subunit